MLADKVNYIQETNKSVKYLKLLMLIFPFPVFLYSFFNIRNFRYHGIILFFSFLYGYSIYLYSGDVVRYDAVFGEFAHISLRDFWGLLLSGYFPEIRSVQISLVGEQPDIYVSTMMFLVSRFTDNSRWYFAIISLIYTALFLSFVREILRVVSWKASFSQIIFFIFLIFLVQFYQGVTGVRFWTALFLFMLCYTKYIRTKSSRYIIISFLSILIHYSFILPVVLLLISRYVIFKKGISNILLLLSFILFISSTNSQVLNFIGSSSTIFENTPIEDRIEGYSDADYLEGRRDRASQTNWYVQWRGRSIFYFLLFAFSLEYFGVIKWRTNEFLDRLYTFYIISLVITLFTYNLGSIARFTNIFYLLSFIRYTVIAGINQSHQGLYYFSIAATPILLLHIAVSFRAGFYTIDPILIYGNPVFIFFVQSSQSLSELIIGH